VSSAKVASSWPFFTTSPTFTRTSVRRRPLLSAPMLASCHAATVPLAASRSARVARSGATVFTASAGRGLPVCASSAARDAPAGSSQAPRASMPAAARAQAREEGDSRCRRCMEDPFMGSSSEKPLLIRT
jgi:hypothetical protein